MNSGRDDSCTPITTQDYWDASWNVSHVPDPIDPQSTRPEDRLYHVLHERFVRALGPQAAPGARLIEIGCGGSRWLPYFQRCFGYEVSGIDYSPAGLRLARQILEKAGVAGDVVEGDLFNPPSRMVEQFDVVASFGVVEHFEPTVRAVAACARYLRPGGVMITTVPTMTGPYGFAYRMLWPAIYRSHVPQTRHSLAQAHAEAALQVKECGYVLGLPTLLTRPAAEASWPRKLAFASSAVYASLERRGVGVPPNALTSPYALCIAAKPRHPAVDGRP